jgi:isopentenyldiphosphate isomerase
MPELLDIYDAEDKPLGIAKPRVDVHRDGDWHRTAHVCVVNPRGEYLVHLRSPLKDSKPSCWDTRFGGHVAAGAGYLDTALRELQEEVGITTRPSRLIVGPRERYDGTANREHTQVYFFRFGGKTSDLRFNDNEVVDVKWMRPEDIVASIEALPSDWVGEVRGVKKICEFYTTLAGKV